MRIRRIPIPCRPWLAFMVKSETQRELHSNGGTCLLKPCEPRKFGPSVSSYMFSKTNGFEPRGCLRDPGTDQWILVFLWMLIICHDTPTHCPLAFGKLYFCEAPFGDRPLRRQASTLIFGISNADTPTTFFHGCALTGKDIECLVGLEPRFSNALSVGSECQYFFDFIHI